MAEATASPVVVDPDDDKITKEILLVSGVVVLGAIMSILDITVVNVAQRTFMQVFDEPNLSTVAWTATGYTLALATVIPVTGWAADRFGTKRLYMSAIALFTLGSLLCATAWNIESLVAFRVLQGLGGGMLMPLGMTIMTRAAGPHRMGRLMAILGIPMLLGPILGPILGGVLIQNLSWHWVFLINLPIGVVALGYAFTVLPKDAPEPTETFDLVGMLLMSPGLALFLFGVSSIPEKGTVEATRVLVPTLIGLALLVTFVFYSFKPRHPLLDLRLFRDRNLTVSILTMVLFIMAFFGTQLLVPTYFQQVRGESVLKAGLLVAPQGLGAMLTMPIAGNLTDRLPIGRIVPFGMLGILLGVGGLTMNTGADTPYWHVMLCLFVMGLGMGGTMMPLFTSALKTLPASQVARGSTLLNVAQQVSASMGVAILTVVLTSSMRDSDVISAASAVDAAQQSGSTPPQAALELVQRLGDGFAHAVTVAMADAYSHALWVGFALLVAACVPIAFLPRGMESVPDEDDEAAPVLMH
ncbi:DHA2 family efflux MFS transporter permease subunit [Nocardioides acrostichi]|uniref:DHA2 family efflux MFS transporter permease subunit n=1 Tax=Nocardioides acrostichi TaxID=2784339 RepID=A0A930UXP1_9ACTN|nr:DHA2 family efflux MFS transporter permease subunit [Nocardioides acrostichi]MBF4161592.1 DHA2 family efflux MFS transporter permease subunit [Nocardioides acrostichi]